MHLSRESRQLIAGGFCGIWRPKGGGIMAELTPKQERFCEEYLIDLNATQAAIRAGYSEKTAREQAAQNLSKLNIQEKIAELKAERSKRTEITQDRVIKELAAMAFAKATDYAQIASNTVFIKSTAELTPEQQAGIVGIKQTQAGIEVKLDKTRALEMLGRHLGMFNDKLELSGAVANPYANLTEAELKKLAGADG